MSEEHIVYVAKLEKNKRLICTNKRIILAEPSLKDQILIGTVCGACAGIGISLGLLGFIILLFAVAFPFTIFIFRRRIKEEKQLKFKGRSFSLASAKVTFVKSTYSRIEPIKFVIEDDVKKVKFELLPKEAQELIEVLKSLGSFMLEVYAVE